VAGAVEDPSLDDDTLTRDIFTGDVATEVILKNFKTRLAWN
jgi:hypothetical protein